MHDVYAGFIRTDSGLVPGIHEAIIDRATYEATRRLNEEARERHGTPSGRSQKVIYPLKGILRCGRCGREYVGSYTIKRGVMRRYYSCASNRRDYLQGCASPHFGADHIEGLLKGYITHFRDDPQVLSALIRQIPGQDAGRIADALYSVDVALQDASPAELRKVFQAAFEQVVVNSNGSQLDVTLREGLS